MSETTRTCVRCRGHLWICEAHLDRPWPHEGCRGAGDPCPVCNAGEKEQPSIKGHEKAEE